MDNDEFKEEMGPKDKLVQLVLGEQGEMRTPEIVEETLLPQRSVEHVFTRLENAGLVDDRPYLQSPEKNVYYPEEKIYND